MPNEFENTHATHFLPITGANQLAGLRDIVKWPAGISQQHDGSLHGTAGLTIDGFKEVRAGFYVPCIPECVDRLHAVFTHKDKIVEYRCASNQVDKKLKVVTCGDCEKCSFRKGRDRNG